MAIESQQTRHYAFLALLLIAIVLGVILFWPFLKVLILSIAFAVVLHPVYRWFLNKVTKGNTWFAALFTIATFLVIICGPLVLISSSVFDQAQSMYTTLTTGGSSGKVINEINALAERYLPWASFDAKDHIAQLAGSVTSSLGDIAQFVISLLFSLFVFILALFYFLEDGARWRKAIIHGSPISDENAEKVLNKLARSIDGVVKGYLFIGLIQGTLLGVGLWIFGVPNPALWGLVAGIASLVPAIGTALVSIPAVLYLFSIGESGAAIGLALWGAALVGMVDNFLSPVIVGRRIDIHPMFILFAVLGGIAVMGPAGILIGPLVISLIYALTSVYSSEMKQ
jgi:predicted PurR-regulated permease PerM